MRGEIQTARAWPRAAQLFIDSFYRQLDFYKTITVFHA